MFRTNLRTNASATSREETGACTAGLRVRGKFNAPLEVLNCFVAAPQTSACLTSQKPSFLEVTTSLVVHLKCTRQSFLCVHKALGVTPVGASGMRFAPRKTNLAKSIPAGAKERLHTDGLLQCFGRLRPVVKLDVRPPEVAPSQVRRAIHQVAGRQAKLGHGLFVAMRVDVEDAQRVARIRRQRRKTGAPQRLIGLNRTAEVPLGGLHILAKHVERAEHGMRLGVVRVEPHGLLQMLERAGDVLLLVEPNPELVLGLRAMNVFLGGPAAAATEGERCHPEGEQGRNPMPNATQHDPVCMDERVQRWLGVLGWFGMQSDGLLTPAGAVNHVEMPFSVPITARCELSQRKQAFLQTTQRVSIATARLLLRGMRAIVDGGGPQPIWSLIMQELGQGERQRLFERFGRIFEAGATIYEENAAAEHCFLIQSGRVRLVKRIRGTERSLTVLKPGDLFGEDALLSRSVRGASAVALTEAQVLALDKKTFGVLLSTNAEVASRLVEQLVRRLRHAEEQVENAMLRDHPSRVINTLLRLAATSEPTTEGYVVNISPLELSSRVGIDVDAVKKAVQQLRDGGYIRIQDERVIIPDVNALKQLYTLLGAKEDVRGGFP